ncbi:MAG: hypothetical protein JJT88_20770 [Gammaproteobacteria bacterium]|nr:hypothetical protein [Gammaproteobacteria bacterium]
MGMRKCIIGAGFAVLVASVHGVPVVVEAPEAENNATARAYFNCVVDSNDFVEAPATAMERCRPERDVLAASVAPKHQRGVIERMDSLIELRWRRDSEREAYRETVQ